VKGHSADPDNDLVDALAVEAARTQAGRRGDAPPDVG
jgi:ribonuclease HI